MARNDASRRADKRHAGDSGCRNVLQAVERGNKEAEYALWDRMDARLRRLFLRLFGGLPRPVVNEEDLSSEVISRLCKEIRGGRLHDVVSWGKLWKLMEASAIQRFASQRETENCQKRFGGRQEFGTGPQFDALPGGIPVADELSELYDEILALLRLPKDLVLRAIVLLRKDEYSKQEAARQLGLALRSVNRLLKPLSGKWSKRNDENSRQAPRSPLPAKSGELQVSNRGARRVGVQALARIWRRFANNGKSRVLVACVFGGPRQVRLESLTYGFCACTSCNRLRYFS